MAVVMDGRVYRRIIDQSPWAVTMSPVSKIGMFGLLLLLLAACDHPPSAPPVIKIGQALPTVNVRDLHGERTTLPLASGKILLLNVWATWCGPCRYEMPSLDRLGQTLDPAKYTVVGLSVDSDEHVVREFLIERNVSFHNYLDPDMAIANRVFGVRAFPSTLLFGPQGQLLDIIEGWREWDSPAMRHRLAELAAQFAEHPARQ